MRFTPFILPSSPQMWSLPAPLLTVTIYKRVKRISSSEGALRLDLYWLCCWINHFLKNVLERPQLLLLSTIKVQQFCRGTAEMFWQDLRYWRRFNVSGKCSFKMLRLEEPISCAAALPPQLIRTLNVQNAHSVFSWSVLRTFLELPDSRN